MNCTFLSTFLGLTPTELYPSEVTDSNVNWVCCFDPNIESAQIQMARVGKWMLFIPPRYINECWDKIIAGVKSGNLYSAKTLPAIKVDKVYATMIYTKDYEDKEDIARVLNYLVSVGLKGKRKIYYKTDDQTRAGIYSGDEERSWIYSSDDFL